MTTDHARRAHLTVLCAWALLAAVIGVWIGARLGQAGALAAGALVLGPLAMPLRGLLAAKRNTLRWAPFTLTPTLAWSLTEVVANPDARPFAAVTLLAALAAFAALLACLRVTP